MGANGTLGRYIALLLREELPDVQIISASRSPGSSHRVIDVLDASTFSSALENIDILIHAAGPFNHDPTDIVTACVSSGIHYIDIAEDLSFIQKVRQAAAKVKQPMACAVTGCSTMPAMVSLFSQRFSHLEKLHSINVYLNLGSANPVSYGLMNGLLQPLGMTLANSNQCFRKLHVRCHRDGVKKYYGFYAAPFSDGILVGNQKIPLIFYTGFDRQYINLGLLAASFLIPHLSHKALNYLSRLLLLPANIARKFGKKEGRLVIEARDIHNKVLDEIEIIAKQDGLKLPAAPAVWVSKALLSNQTASLPYRNVDLSHFISVSSATEWIRSRGYEVLD